MAFNREKAKKAGYSNQEIDAYLASKQPQPQKTLPGFIGNVGRNIGDIAGGLGNIAQTTGQAFLPTNVLFNPQQAGEAQQKLLQTTAGIPGQLLSEVGQAISNPMEYAYQNPIDILLALFPGLKFGGAAAKTAGRYVRTGKKIEEAAGRIPSVPSSMLEERFGTFTSPKEELYRGLAPAQGQIDLKNQLVREIVTQGRTGGGAISEPTGLDILGYRKGARAVGKVEKGKLATPEQRLFQRMGSEYSKVIQELSPELKALDKVFSQKAKAGSLVKKLFPFGVGGVIGYYLLNRLLPRQ